MPRSFDSVFYGAAGGGEDLPSDDEFNRVSFLSHFDGANNGVNNAFDDGSADNRTITTAGNMAQGSFGPFARPDGEFGVDTSGGWTYWGYNVASTGALGDEDFCMECFVFINSFAAKQGIASRNYSGTGIGNETWRWEVQTNGTMTMISKNFFGQDAAGLTSSTALTLNTWHHVAAVRQNDTLTFYIDGTARGATSSGSGVFSTSNAMWNIGANGYQTSTSTSLQGTMSNFRLVVGSAVYTGNFTAPSSKLTAITNTEMLAYQSNRFVDNSADGNSLTPVSSPAVTAFGPFLTSAVYDPAVNGASAYFNASSAILVASPPSFGPQSWTFECWFYFTADGTYRVLFAQGPANGTDVSEFYRSSNNKLTFQVATSGANRIIMNTAVNVTSNNEWVHCALTHEYTSSSNSTYKIYQNGILGQTLNHTGGYNWASGAGSGRPIVIGRSEWEGAYNSVPSYVQDSRLVVGSVVYTSNFTPPTAPLTAITNTKLLLNMADGQAIDSAAQNNLTLYGNANTSTDQAKFGNAALHLDGTGDFAKTELSTAFGLGDFTIECFYYNSASFASANRYLFDFGSNGLRVQFYNGTIYYFVDANNSVTTTASGVTHNNWYHLAAVRYNGQMNLYIGGVSRATKNSVTTNLTERSLTIGDYGGGGQALQGFIDEFRISNFARYTSNFTAPSAAFADKGQDA